MELDLTYSQPIQLLSFVILKNCTAAGRGAPLLSGHSWKSCFIQLYPANTHPASSSPLLLLRLHCRVVPAVPSSMEAPLRLAAEGRTGLGLTQLFFCPFPMHRPPEGVQGARITQLPSIKLVLKELSGHNSVSVPLATALAPGPAPAQHQLRRSSSSALFPLPRIQHWMPAAWRRCSSTRLRSGSLSLQSHPTPPLTQSQGLMQLTRGLVCCEAAW